MQNKSLKQMKFSTDIDAPPSRVWKTLWSDTSYPEWTSVFSPGSRAVSDWREGSKIQFLDGEGRGMDSVIERSVPNEFMSFRHMGEIKEGKVQPLDEKTSQWSGGHENYRLTERDGRTRLTVELESPEEYATEFNDKFPQALQRLKEIAERGEAR